MRMLMDEGVEANFLDADALAALEPALAPVKDRFAGAVHTPRRNAG